LIYLVLITNFLEKLAFTSKEQREILKGRGEKELSDYYHHLTDTPVTNLYAAEYLLELDDDDLKFKGRIDKLEKNSDGTYSIYDYKTGKAKNHKEICIGGEHEDYYNQICLYKYYFEKQKNVKVRDVGFIFPIDSSVYRFTPTDDECQEVVDKFKNAVQGIKNSEFEATPSENSCQYCPYKDFCAMNAV
ncbi:MAG: PD-(D/E)XK nuclease family protein, partial [Candidatus Gastranaerophilales bacterium]|nr:PD-(D/E)XK nuclease family protein [Candidatus Gastranaerophilales bacterium]